QEVETKYVILCADDDFIIPAAIEKCRHFLDSNPSYAVVQGNCVCFKKEELLSKKDINFYPIYDYLDYAYEEEAPLLRLDSLLSNYKSLLYAMHRTDLLKNAYTGASDHITNLYLNEYNASILPVIKGRYKELDCLYQVREYATDSDDKTAVNINTIVKNTAFSKDLDAFLLYISHKIKEQLPEESREKLKERLLSGLQKLAESIDRRASAKPTLKKRVGNIISGIPLLGSELIKANRRAELNNQLNRIVKTKEDQLELSRVQSILQKYRY